MKTVFALGLAGGIAIGASLAALGQDKPSAAAFTKAMDTMMGHMHMPMTGDTDKDFANMMAAHGQAAIDLAKVELDFGKDAQLKEMAQRIVDNQQRDVKFLYDWLVLSQADDHH